MSSSLGGTSFRRIAPPNNLQRGVDRKKSNFPSPKLRAPFGFLSFLLQNGNTLLPKSLSSTVLRPLGQIWRLQESWILELQIYQELSVSFINMLIIWVPLKPLCHSVTFSNSGDCKCVSETSKRTTLNEPGLIITFLKPEKLYIVLICLDRR